MKTITNSISVILLVSVFLSCNEHSKVEEVNNESTHANLDKTTFIKTGYSEINGIRMYYEIHGEGNPLVLIHGGGSTIETNFGKILPLFAKNHKVVVMELQAHGRTADRNKPLSFEQDADDVATLLNSLQIKKADVLGFSNGGQTAIEMALRHPELINKLILASTFINRDAVSPEFWDIFKNASLKNMPKPLKDGFLKVNNDSVALLKMFNRDVERMQNFKGWSDDQIRSIKAPTLIMNGTKDVASIEHATGMHHLIPNSDLVILPGLHGAYLGEVTTLQNGKWEYPYSVEIIEEFLNSSRP